MSSEAWLFIVIIINDIIISLIIYLTNPLFFSCFSSDYISWFLVTFFWLYFMYGHLHCLPKHHNSFRNQLFTLKHHLLNHTVCSSNCSLLGVTSCNNITFNVRILFFFCAISASGIPWRSSLRDIFIQSKNLVQLMWVI